jgi:nicotinamidase-related amidase
MSFLSALLSQQTPHLQTRKGLIVVGLQNDFILPTGKLPVRDAAFVDRIESLIPAFRPHGEIVWVRSEFQQTRPVNGDDTPGDTVLSSDTEPELPSSEHVPTASKKLKVNIRAE